ncbi:hypothetical protein SASPL_120616 [Salvia splendens]|uniref:Uncharacterized protein n=1 Tax=Salvia splendens TaxID=180675 RepID=A0A8X8ZU42_SALSN|nr:hypothetical protein SASPL_120616 [Salvia splendens]
MEERLTKPNCMPSRFSKGKKQMQTLDTPIPEIDYTSSLVSSYCQNPTALEDDDIMRRAEELRAEGIDNLDLDAIFFLELHGKVKKRKQILGRCRKCNKINSPISYFSICICTLDRQRPEEDGRALRAATSRSVCYEEKVGDSALQFRALLVLGHYIKELTMFPSTRNVLEKTGALLGNVLRNNSKEANG